MEVNSSWNKIIQNTIIQRNKGIFIAKNCSFNLIKNNTLEFYDYDKPYGPDSGIQVYISNRNNITFNSISRYYYAILLALSNFSYIANNTFYENSKNCVAEYNCMGNIINDDICIPKPNLITGFNVIIVAILILAYLSLIKKVKKKRI